MKNSQSKPQWTFSRELSDSENQIYTHSFHILKDKFTGRTTLIGEFIYNKTTGTVFTNVVNSNDGVKYTPFYDNKYGNFEPILNKIYDAILKEMKKVGLQCQ